MSRCFPFPPPGYEKKPRSDDADWLAKEKRKEKKHKKDKKDKERKEGKEKGDKEKRKEEKREKKERKEKHKDKDRDRDKDKKHKERDSDKKNKKRKKDEKEASDVRRVEEHPHCFNAQKPGQDITDSKIMQELARRIRDEDGATGRQVVKNISFADKGRADLPGMAVGNSISHLSSEKYKDKKDVDRRINGLKTHIEIPGLSRAVDKCSSPVDQRRLDAFTMPSGKKYVEKQMEVEWKNGWEEIENNGDKVKHRDWEKRIKEKDVYRDKEKEEKDIIKTKFDTCLQKPSLKNGAENSIGICKTKPSDLLKDGSKSTSTDGNLGKRKELDRNGYAHANGVRLNKLPRSVSSSQPVLVNGRKLGSCQQASEFASEKHLAASNGKNSINGNKINGFLEPQQPHGSSIEHYSSNLQVTENGEGSGKPPHPDSMQLSRILSVPRLEELPETDDDDQEWLFTKNNLVAEKSSGGTGGEVSQQVWAKALQIPNADIVALPYVIPY